MAIQLRFGDASIRPNPSTAAAGGGGAVSPHGAIANRKTWAQTWLKNVGSQPGAVDSARRAAAMSQAQGSGLSSSDGDRWHRTRLISSVIGYLGRLRREAVHNSFAPPQAVGLPAPRDATKKATTRQKHAAQRARQNAQVRGIMALEDDTDSPERRFFEHTDAARTLTTRTLEERRAAAAASLQRMARGKRARRRVKGELVTRADGKLERIPSRGQVGPEQSCQLEKRSSSISTVRDLLVEHPGRASYALSARQGNGSDGLQHEPPPAGSTRAHTMAPTADAPAMDLSSSLRNLLFGGSGAAGAPGTAAAPPAAAPSVAAPIVAASPATASPWPAPTPAEFIVDISAPAAARRLPPTHALPLSSSPGGSLAPSSALPLPASRGMRHMAQPLGTPVRGTRGLRRAPDPQHQVELPCCTVRCTITPQQRKVMKKYLIGGAAVAGAGGLLIFLGWMLAW